MSSKILFVFDEKENIDNCVSFFLSQMESAELRVGHLKKYVRFFQFGINSARVDEVDFDNEQIKYYPLIITYLQIFNDNVSVFDYMPFNIKQQIQKGKLNVLFLISCEAFVQMQSRNASWWIQKFYQILNQHQIPIEHIHWAISDTRVKVPFLNVHFYNYFLDAGVNLELTKTTNLNHLDSLNEAMSTVAKTKHFICLNRQPKIHRILLVYELYKRDLISKGLVSCMQPGHEKDYAIYQHTNEVTDHIYRTKDHAIKDFIKTLPYDLDNFHNLGTWWETFKGDDVNYISNFYAKCCFDIVSETHVKDYFVTEKTTKPIFYKMPFMVLSSPGYLNYLRSLGFETFPELFDESYDEETDLIIRIQKIANNANRLCRLDLSELQHKIHAVKDKLDHNIKHLINLNLFDKLIASLSNSKYKVRTPYNNSATYHLVKSNYNGTFPKLLLDYADLQERYQNSHILHARINTADKSELLTRRATQKLKSS